MCAKLQCETTDFTLLSLLSLQLATILGIVIAQLVMNYGAQYIHLWGWQLALGLVVVPALTIITGAYLLPETPNSLIERSDNTEGRRVLELIRGTTGEN